MFWTADKVHKLDLGIQSSIGAPCPTVVGNERNVFLLFYLENRDDKWDGTTIRVINPLTSEEPVAVIKFDGYSALKWGPPNDEAFQGHPLASKGLGPYGIYEIFKSSWIDSLERMNRVHRLHSKDLFAGLRHLIFSFHDSTFEVVTKKFELKITRGSIGALTPSIVSQLFSS